MASHLDLEEQEQLDQFKHFWSRWGNLITGLITAVLLVYSSYNGWHYWQQRQASQASVLYDTFEKSVRDADLTLMGRSLGDLQNQFGRTTYAHQAALLSARIYANKANLAEAEKALQWVIENGHEEGYVALARLRLSALAMDQKTWIKPKTCCKGTKPQWVSNPCLMTAWGILLCCKTNPKKPNPITSVPTKAWRPPTNTVDWLITSWHPWVSTPSTSRKSNEIAPVLCIALVAGGRLIGLDGLRQRHQNFIIDRPGYGQIRAAAEAALGFQIGR